MSIVKKNLMGQKGYRPYCGNSECKVTPRTVFNGEQFKCNSCGWESYFETEFIKEYKNKWSIENE